MKTVHFVEVWDGAKWLRLPDEHASASRAGRVAMNAQGQARVVRGPSAELAAAKVMMAEVFG